MSLYTRKLAVCKFPKTIRLYNHKEYAPPKTIPVAPKNANVVLNEKIPIRIKNSPIKLLVPGNAIFAKVYNKKIQANKGIR